MRSLIRFSSDRVVFCRLLQEDIQPLVCVQLTLQALLNKKSWVLSMLQLVLLAEKTILLPIPSSSCCFLWVGRCFLQMTLENWFGLILTYLFARMVSTQVNFLIRFHHLSAETILLVQGDGITKSRTEL